MTIQNCLKTSILFIIPAISVAITIAAFIIYAVFRSQMNAKENKEYLSLYSTPTGEIMLLVLLIFSIIACVFGLLIFCCRNKFWRVVYLVVLSIMLIVEFVVFILLLVLVPYSVFDMHERWYNALDSEDPEKFKIITSAEKHWDCCGYENITEEDIDRCSQYPRGYNKDIGLNRSCEKLIQDSIMNTYVQYSIGVIIVFVLEIILYVFTIYYHCMVSKISDGGSYEKKEDLN